MLEAIKADYSVGFKRGNQWLVGRVLSIDTQKQILTVQVGDGSPIEIHRSEVRPPF
jgi:hypothetical protein